MPIRYGYTVFTLKRTKKVEATKYIAQFIRDSLLSSIPGDAVEKAKKSIADTIGVMLAGAGSEVAPPLRRYVTETAVQGSTSVLGTNIQTSPEVAALINGTLGHALDFDDVLTMMTAHPSSTIVAALLADASRLTIGGRKFLEAYIVGIEIGAKIGLGMTVGHFGRGFHPQGTLCIFAGLGALAKLRAFDVQATQMAFGIAGSLTSGLRRNVGTMTKPLHAGWAARSALVAANLARCGFTAALDIMEANNGFFSTYGVESSDPNITCDSLGNPWAIVDPGIALKRFPCCYASHRAMDGVLALIQKMQITAANLEKVECRYPPGATVSIRGYPRPRTGLEAKFSLEYSVAAGILDGGYTLESFSDTAVMRREIQPLLEKIRITEDPRCGDDDPLIESRSISSRGYVEVEITKKDGRREIIRVDHAPGHPPRELAWEEIHEKFTDCAASVSIARPKADEAFELLRNFDSCEDVNQLVSQLALPERLARTGTHREDL